MDKDICELIFQDDRPVFRFIRFMIFGAVGGLVGYLSFVSFFDNIDELTGIWKEVVKYSFIGT